MIKFYYEKQLHTKKKSKNIISKNHMHIHMHTHVVKALFPHITLSLLLLNDAAYLRAIYLIRF